MKELLEPSYAGHRDLLEAEPDRRHPPVSARYDEIYPCHGDLLRLSEPEDVNPAWKSRSVERLKPKTFYPFRPDEAMARQ